MQVRDWEARGELRSAVLPTIKATLGPLAEIIGIEAARSDTVRASFWIAQGAIQLARASFHMQGDIHFVVVDSYRFRPFVTEVGDASVIVLPSAAPENLDAALSHLFACRPFREAFGLTEGEVRYPRPEGFSKPVMSLNANVPAEGEELTREVRACLLEMAVEFIVHHEVAHAERRHLQARRGADAVRHQALEIDADQAAVLLFWSALLRFPNHSAVCAPFNGSPALQLKTAGAVIYLCLRLMEPPGGQAADPAGCSHPHPLLRAERALAALAWLARRADMTPEDAYAANWEVLNEAVAVVEAAMADITGDTGAAARLEQARLAASAGAYGSALAQALDTLAAQLPPIEAFAGELRAGLHDRFTGDIQESLGVGFCAEVRMSLPHATGEEQVLLSLSGDLEICVFLDPAGSLGIDVHGRGLEGRTSAWLDSRLLGPTADQHTVGLQVTPSARGVELAAFLSGGRECALVLPAQARQASVGRFTIGRDASGRRVCTGPRSTRFQILRSTLGAG